MGGMRSYDRLDVVAGERMAGLDSLQHEQKRKDAIVQLLYLWTRDAGIAVDEMDAYIEERWKPLKRMIYSDEERAAAARRAAGKML